MRFVFVVSVVRTLTILLASATAIGCATTVELEGSTLAPAASGTVKVEEGSSGNAVVTLEIEHLAPPARLIPPRSHYVAWADSGAGGRVVLLGLVSPDDSLEAELVAPVPFARFRILVTAEDKVAPRYPSSEKVFETDYLSP